MLALVTDPAALALAASRSSEGERTRAETAALAAGLRAALGLQLAPAAVRGAGVDEQMFLAFLKRLSGYLQRRQGQGQGKKGLGVLSGLSGLRSLGAGRYLGLAQDGGVILPWDIELPD